MRMSQVLATLLSLLLLAPVGFGQEKTERSYKLNPNCVNIFALLGRSDDERAILDALPDPKISEVYIIDSIGSGTGTIRQDNVRWDGVNAHAFMGYTKSEDGKLVRHRIGLIEKVVTPAGTTNVVFDESTGKAIDNLREVWVVRTERDAHLDMAEALPNCRVFFIDEIDSKSLQRAAKNRTLIQQKINAISKRNSSLLYALPRTPEELASMGFSKGSTAAWQAAATTVDSLGFRQFQPKTADSREVMKFLFENLANGRNVLLWAHSPDGKRLAIPTIDKEGESSILLFSPEEIALVQLQVAKATKTPGLLLINGCRVSSYVGLAQHIVGESAPNLSPRDQFASANISVLEQIAKAGATKEKPRQRKKNRDANQDKASDSPAWLAKLAGNLSVLLAVGLADDEDNDDDKKEGAEDQP